MMSAIESNVMVNPLNDSNNFKRIEVQQGPSNTTSHSQIDEEVSISMSDTSKHLSSLKECILNAPDVNQSRVQFLKEELASGRYRIVSDDIAIKMLADIELA
ncbi:flagellar biosynthesis anti-sigma factor FlgM [Legionella maceachernii]|uniref:Negative regulator of flagellin synthesis n=1 Tax=Legionella maceachernii TaxID=466 RepID=A0A0W0VYR4_9GAMM|nr:flagellar biosynthesis anti-sigma factor FlgM [Legionella maceachernii]KTD25240.1 flagellin synthesis negative regulator [Legionella maceachernii]SJZ77121.1 anti-sigma-28 factor, FlgM family [Legionella maceachernii]SUP03057.1 flagellar biosynthesis anti-sigma factor FlgM [Legionella maceachernii]